MRQPLTRLSLTCRSSMAGLSVVFSTGTVRAQFAQDWPRIAPNCAVKGWSLALVGSHVSETLLLAAGSIIAVLLAALGAEWIFYRRYMRRMRHLLDRAGNVIDHAVVERTRELTRSHETLVEELNELRNTETKLRSAQAMLEETTQRYVRLAEVDPLTELPNRRRFEEFLDREWRRASRSRLPMTLILMSIDSFKQFNETYGQSVADDCLRAITDVLTSTASRSGSMIARVGAEQFAVLLCDTGRDGGMNMARRIEASAEQLAIEHETTKVFDASIVTLSIGVAVDHADLATAPSLLLVHADEALYAAQQDGGNCIRSFEEATGTRLRVSFITNEQSDLRASKRAGEGGR